MFQGSGSTAVGEDLRNVNAIYPLECSFDTPTVENTIRKTMGRMIFHAEMVGPSPELDSAWYTLHNSKDAKYDPPWKSWDDTPLLDIFKKCKDGKKLDYYCQRDCINKLQVINEVKIETYLEGVIGGEMPLRWPESALAAQSIAARTYALYYIEKNSSSPYDLGDDEKSQMYR